MYRPSQAVSHSGLYIFPDLGFRSYSVYVVGVDIMSCYFLSATPQPPTGFFVLAEKTGDVRVQWGLNSVYSSYSTLVIVTYHAEHKPRKVCYILCYYLLFPVYIVLMIK